MKNISGFLLLSVLATTVSASSFASELKDCEKKISEMIGQVPTMEVKALSATRADQYHLSADAMCGVELIGHALTVTKFETPATVVRASVVPAKFETIILNGSDPTFTEGRVKAVVTCEMTNNSVVYTTKVPVLTDGVKSPFVIEKLTMIQENNKISVSLRASQTPIQKVFRSITACDLSIESRI